MSRVAIIDLEEESTGLAFRNAVHLIGGIDDINTSRTPVVIKVGVFDPKEGNHSSVEVVDAIINGFDNASTLYLAESDNHLGSGTERLQIWKALFSERVIPFNLSDDPHTKKVTLGGQDMDLSHILFNPHVLVDTHVLRTYSKGSILKNLFGCTPHAEKSKFHHPRILFPLLADMYEAIGGIDLAVLDGTCLWHQGNPYTTNLLVVGKDAVAVETVGAYLAGLNPQEMPVLQEFVKRGLGEGNLQEIEVVGETLQLAREKCASALQKAQETETRAP